MSFAFVNGVVLQHVHLLGLSKVNELVGPNLARVKLTAKLRGLYNPAMASYLFASAGGQSAFGPLFRPGLIGPVTEQAVQWALQQPRKPFALLAGGVLIAFGPKPVTVRSGQPVGAGFLAGLVRGLEDPVLTKFLGNLGGDIKPVVKQKYGLVDVNNGPLCSADVVENIGDKTFHVEWTVTTWINDAPQPGTVTSKGTSTVPQYPTPPLLANEYEMVHVIDQDFFSVRFVQGRAVFRSDVLQALKLFPDQLRYWLGLPTPARFRREQIRVRQLSDGLTTEYSYVDRERVLSFDPNVFTRVEMTVLIDEENLGLESIVRRGAGGALDAFQGIRAGTASGATGWLSGMVGDLLARRIGTVAGIAGFGAAALAGIPVTNYRAVGRFWGHARQRREFLNRQATSTFNHLLQGYSFIPLSFASGGIFGGGISAVRFLGLNLQLGDTQTRTTHDLSGMFLQRERSWVGSRLQGILSRIASVAAALVETNTNPVRAILANPMRGTYLGGAVASALRDSSDTWVQSVDPLAVRDREDTLRHPGDPEERAGAVLDWSDTPPGPVAGITLP